MCTVPSTPVSLGRPLSSPSCSACLPFCSLFNLPHHFCRIFTHSHAFTHTHALASSLPQCVLHFPTHQCYLRGTFLQALTHSHSCTCSPTQTHTHTHTNAHTYSHTRTHAPVFYIPGHLAIPWIYCGLPRWCSHKESACKCRRCKRHRSDSWVWKIPWMRKWQPLQYSCLRNIIDRGAMWATVHGVTKSLAWLSTHTHALALLQRAVGIMGRLQKVSRPLESTHLALHDEKSPQ